MCFSIIMLCRLIYILFLRKIRFLLSISRNQTISEKIYLNIVGSQMPLNSYRLFQETFSNKDYPSAEREYFRINLLELRNRVIPIVAQIARDMPGYTVHDITHLDALWEMASLIAGDDLSLNPPEAFVFGAAILVHDASMTFAAFPNGISDLKETQTWKDYAALEELKGSKQLGDSEIAPNVLRILHAKNAENIIKQNWQESDHSSLEHLIQDNDLRRFYAKTIGEIAHSHWWGIGEVASKLDNYLGGMPSRTSSQIDKLKLAALLRAADVIHLDSRRAPHFLKVIEKPKGESKLHWDFQSKMSKPSINGDALQFTAGEPFEMNESQSWWLAFDALTLADKELRDTDIMLREKGRNGLKVRRIRGVNDPRELANDIPVNGWKPINSPFHISDIPNIITTLGGAKLYGNNSTAPLRELLQNAVDAIKARRLVQDDPEWGKIIVELIQRDGHHWLIIEDDGVGMSENVLTHCLVNFGSSLWKSNLVAGEFPGLLTEGMKAVGQYGIGFFSVFMIADEVNVYSRRYDLAKTDTIRMHFNNGVFSRPVLSPANASSVPANGGTKIELKLFADPLGHGEFSFITDRNYSKTENKNNNGETIEVGSINDLVKKIAPCLDVDVFTKNENNKNKIISSNDWISCDLNDLVYRSSNKKDIKSSYKYIDRIKKIVKKDGAIIGRAAINPDIYLSGNKAMLTTHGFAVQNYQNIAGLVLGDVSNAARTRGTIMFDEDAYKVWAEEQAALLAKDAQTDDEYKALCCNIILELNASTGDLPLALNQGYWFNVEDIKEAIATLDKINVITDEVEFEPDDNVLLSDFQSWFEHNEDVFYIPSPRSNFLTQKTSNFYNTKLYSYIHFKEIVESVWGDFNVESEYGEIGTVNGVAIFRSVDIFTRSKL